MLTVLAGIVDFERSLVAERTSAGRIEARAQGVKFGRTPILSVEQIEHARQLINEDNKPVREVATLLGVHRSTLYRAIGSPARESRYLRCGVYEPSFSGWCRRSYSS